MKQDEAKKLIKYYFRMIAEKAGMNWDSDNDAEIDCAIDLLIEACVEKIANENKVI